MIILKNSSLLSFNQFLSPTELFIFNTLLFQYKVLRKSEISISDLKFKIGTKYSQNKHLKDSLQQLTEKVIRPKYINKVKEIESTYVSFFDFINIDNKTINFKFSNELLKFIDSKDSSFYNLDFKKISELKNIHTITIYELILDFSIKQQKSTTLYFNFNFLRKILGLEDKYLKNSEFKNKVLNKVIDSLSSLGNIDIELLEKNRRYILKIVNHNSVINTSVLEEITSWFDANPDEVELYKETLLCSNQNLDSKLLEFDHVKKSGQTFYAVFKYNSFLLDVEIIKEDLQIILENNNGEQFDA